MELQRWMTTVQKAHILKVVIHALKVAADEAAIETKAEPLPGAQLTSAAECCISGYCCKACNFDGLSVCSRAQEW